MDQGLVAEHRETHAGQLPQVHAGDVDRLVEALHQRGHRSPDAARVDQHRITAVLGCERERLGESRECVLLREAAGAVELQMTGQHAELELDAHAVQNHPNTPPVSNA